MITNGIIIYKKDQKKKWFKDFELHLKQGHKLEAVRDIYYNIPKMENDPMGHLRRCKYFADYYQQYILHIS